MPVSWRSLASNSASHCLPLRIASRYLSSCSWKPSLMTLPSVICSGASSSMALSINATNSSSGSNSINRSFHSPRLMPLINWAIRGTCCKEDFSCRRSRPLTLPKATRPTKRSMSYTFVSASCKSARSKKLSNNDWTISWRAKIFFGWIKGRSNHCFNKRAPIAVLVSSNNHKSVPCFWPVRMDRLNSRLNFE